jgi:hypothetical protein
MVGTVAQTAKYLRQFGRQYVARIHRDHLAKLHRRPAEVR